MVYKCRVIEESKEGEHIGGYLHVSAKTLLGAVEVVKPLLKKGQRLEGIKPLFELDAEEK